MNNVYSGNLPSEASQRVLQHLADKGPKYFAFLRKRVESVAVAEGSS